MAYDRPFYCRSVRADRRPYTTRILVGLVAALSLLVLLVHLPVSNRLPIVNWGAASSSEHIEIHQIGGEPEVKAGTASGRQDDGAAPETKHGPVVNRLTGDESKGDDTGSEKETRPERTRPGLSNVLSVADLGLADNQPQLIGGMGTLYLHIDYPRAAREQGIEGRMEVNFTVGREGDVRRIHVSKSLHPLLDSAAVRALRSVRFRPATRDGDPIPVRMNLPIRFELRSNVGTLRSSHTSQGDQSENG